VTIAGKAVVVTGAFGAIGAAVAEEAAQRGAWVAALDLAATAPAGFAERLGPNGLILGGVDLALPHAAERAMAAAGTRFGRIDAKAKKQYFKAFAIILTFFPGHFPQFAAPGGKT
jgi:NAD(P)-dependent dehydrogenase (short-subunit alcohol dehydrogenase family)